MICVCAAVRPGNGVVLVGACLGVPAGSGWALGLGFGVLWLLTRAPLLSDHLGFGTGLIN